uniref:hypothetical protein n=1 Tax=Pseudomonas sp. GLE121 TaxID=1329969 RepID=UPI00156332FB|nr:hypothetical protein [Pseudomonas sp. GLE121]
MSTSFLERSRLERKIIDVVNDKFQKIVELDGLSVPTLEKWSKKVSSSAESLDKALLSKISLLLSEISQRISSDSDSSKHIFSNGYFSKNSTVDVCFIELKKTLNII